MTTTFNTQAPKSKINTFFIKDYNTKEKIHCKWPKKVKYESKKRFIVDHNTENLSKWLQNPSTLSIYKGVNNVVKLVKGKVTRMLMFQRAWGKDESSCLIDILRHAVMSMHI